MQKDLLKDRLTPAEGEVSVRSYYCTYYQSRLLGLEASGYLGVTNKRVIFQALGTSNAGSSVIQSELPIADVSGISSYKGTFFSFGHLLGAFLVSSIVSGAIIGIMSLLGGIISYAASNTSAIEIIGWVLGIGTFAGSLALARHLIWRPVLAVTSSTSFVMAGGGGLVNRYSALLFGGGGSSNGLSVVAFLFAFAVGIYALFCVFWYSRRPTFSLAINSKGGSSTPISISGSSGIGIFDVSAGKALAAEPAEDSEPMLQELGAVILDIQMLGDLGINKWRSSAK